MSAPPAQPMLFGGAAPSAQTPTVTPSAITIRPYQAGAIAWVASERAPGARLLLVSPTGSGKTFTAAQIILDEIARGGRVIFAAHRQELISQTYGSLLRLGLEERAIGVIMGDGVITHPLTRRRANCARPLAPVQVASIDTLRNRPKPQGVTMLFFDEAHRALSLSYVKLAEAYPDATVVGLTATPWRGDGRGLGDLFAALHVVATPKQLMDDGHLIEPRVFSHPHRADVSKVATVAGDYNEKQLAEACDKKELVGSIVEHWRRHLDGRRTVAFAVNVEHSKHIVEQFVAAGIPAEHLDGTTHDDERAGILGRLASGQTLVVSNCAVLCLDEQTEILTSAGWVGIDAMTTEHLVANWDNGAVTFEQPSEVVRRERAPGERMVRALGRQIDARVTEGHGMLYRTKRGGAFLKVPARDIVDRKIELPLAGVASPASIAVEASPVSANKRRLLRNATRYNLRKLEGYSPEAAAIEADRRVERKLSLRHKSPDELTLEECRFIGFWIGDGSRAKLARGGVEYIVAQSHAYPKIIEWFDGVVERMGVHCVKRTVAPAKGQHPSSHESSRWSFPRGTGGGSQERAGLFAIESYLDKNGSPLLWGLDEPRFDALIEGLWLADGDHRAGTKRTGRAFRIHSVNVALLNALQAIGAARGYATAIVRGGNQQKNPAYQQNFILRMTKRATLFMSRERFELEAGWRAERVWCVRTRTKNIITRRGGKVLVMGNCEGFDCPAVEGCILARPTKSLSLFLQCAGRALRPAPGKVAATILDHAGSALEHGLPQDDREYSLDGKKKRAKQAVSVKECPKCFAALPSSAKVCFFCGHSFAEAVDPDAGKLLEERDGDLVEMRANALRALKVQTADARAELHDWTNRVDHAERLEAGSTNKRTFRVFRKSRSEMTPAELTSVRAWMLCEWPWLAPVVAAPMLRFAAPTIAEASPW